MIFKMVIEIRRTIVKFIRDAPPAACYDEAFRQICKVGPFKKGELAELPQDCAEYYLQSGYARLATLEELEKWLVEKWKAPREVVREFLESLEKVK